MLKAMNPSKYTKEELKANAANAADAYADSRAADAYADTYATVRVAAAIADAVYAARVAAYATACVAADAADAEYWVNRYFEHTGENRQDYIDEINKGE